MNIHKRKPFSKDLILISNTEETINRITIKLKNDILNTLKRKGGVVGISGGIDSSVTVALAVRALGKDKVLGMIMPEKDSSPVSKTLALKLAKKLKIQTIEENITGALKGFKCYERRDEAVKKIFSEYEPNLYKMKIGINKRGIDQNLPPVFSVTLVDSKNKEKTQLLPVNEYLQIVAASNFKQRSRMSVLYYHAERLHYAVIGTSNKHETDQGFFVKYGDRGADVMPIGNLYKTHIYQLAEYLKIPQEIIKRVPTTDTYPAEQSQEEFFYQIPFKIMDILWYGYENGYPPSEVASEIQMDVNEVENIFRNFARKKETTKYLRMSPIRDF